MKAIFALIVKTIRKEHPQIGRSFYLCQPKRMQKHSVLPKSIKNFLGKGENDVKARKTAKAVFLQNSSCFHVVPLTGLEPVRKVNSEGF